MKSIRCYDITNNCEGCSEKESCETWEETQRIQKAVENGIIGYRCSPDGSITPLKSDTII